MCHAIMNHSNVSKWRVKISTGSDRNYNLKTGLLRSCDVQVMAAERNRGHNKMRNTTPPRPPNQRKSVMNPPVRYYIFPPLKLGSEEWYNSSFPIKRSNRNCFLSTVTVVAPFLGHDQDSLKNETRMINVPYKPKGEWTLPGKTIHNKI